ncbi:S41 family peptidase [uncultured Tenacibaculum sp.]|uniref:S41 family peptidase n=1 Tax=uncultured Tenacibaculum sp. TaxID=174713 RepID=UPI002619E50A|nr:S41 family peptidase [uncultured Tenacibaculum sp.]
MNKNYLPIFFAIATAFGILVGYFFSGNNARFNKVSANEQKVKRLINFIQRDYVDKVDTDQLLDGAIAEMLSKLDPHSVYIPKENLQAITENMQGNFVGIGVQFRLINDSITVIHPMEGGPSIKKGILAGDRILMADEDTLYGKRLRNGQILKKLKGAPNSQVNLQVYRKSNDSLFNISIGRGKINIKSVDVAYMLNDSIGYIKLDRFAQNTYREFKTSLDNLLSKGMTDLVLDLRGNGGGFIHIANKIVDEFLEDDKLIVFTKNNGGEVVESFATEDGDFEDGGLYVLIDENSASASEIVAGALQDNDKGTIIGRRSFGKGLVQEEMDLGDGSAVRLTTARYYTPTGRSIQKPYRSKGKKIQDQFKGVNSLELTYDEEVESRYRNGELFNKDSIKLVDSLQYKTPKGKVVYGGGGIVPDVFVPIDTTAYLPAIFFGPMNDFAFNYVDNNREALNKLSFEEFVDDFDKDQKISDRFFTQIKDVRTSAKTKEKLRKLLKINIARELFNDEGWYRLNHLDDKMIKQVLELEKK